MGKLSGFTMVQSFCSVGAGRNSRALTPDTRNLAPAASRLSAFLFLFAGFLLLSVLPASADLLAVDNDGGATNVAAGTTTLRGTLTNGVAASLYVCWGTADGGASTAAWQNVVSVGYLNEGAFSTNVTGLYYGLRYYYCGYATNAYGDAWAPATTNFTTLKPASNISLSNTVASGLSCTSAVLNATLRDTQSVFDVWAYWNTVNGGTNAAAWTNTAYVGSYTNCTPTNLACTAGLSSNTLYYFTFRATNVCGDLWATNVQTFLTGQVTIQATDPDASEVGPDTGQFTVYRPVTATNGALAVNYAIGGTAGNGVDYQALSGSVIIPDGATNATITVTPIPDLEWTEPDETVALTLLPGAYLVGSPSNAVVTITNDPVSHVVYVDMDAVGANDGTTWANAYTNLTNAIARSPGGSGFWVAEGTYYSPIAAGVEMSSNHFYGGFAGTEAYVTDRDWAAHPTILDGGNSNRVLQKTAAGVSVLDGFTVQNGTNTANGGGLYCTNGAMNIYNCVFTNNLAGSGGGAIYHAGSVTNNVFSNCTFTANRLTQGSGYGGAIYFSGTSTNVFQACLFVTNASTFRGGAIASYGSDRYTGCVFSNNINAAFPGTGGGGGAIYSRYSGPDLSGGSNVFYGNQAWGSNAVGGAIYMSHGTNTIFVLSNCTFIANTAVSYGGAIDTAPPCTTLVANCAFAGNIATNGGAINFNDAGVYSLINCTFLTNAATGSGVGGAVRTANAAARLAVTNCIFWANATAGGTGTNIQNAGTLNLAYCDIATNANAVKGGTNNFGAGITNVDPLFASATAPYDLHEQSTVGRYSGGGWVVDAAQSPCIDAGAPASDYSNEPQPSGGAINLGRYGNTPEASKSLPARIDNDGGASNITETTADLNGYLYVTNGTATDVRVYWGASDGGTNKANWGANQYFGQLPAGQCSTNISAAAATRYWYRFYASNIYGEAWAPSSSTFRTLATPGVDNDGGASGITATNAALNGVLTDGGQAYVTVYWGRTDGGTNASAWSGTNSVGLRNEGAFSSALTGLTLGVWYYYRCYASNSLGDVWASSTANFFANRAAAGQTWDGGSTVDDNWGDGTNWVGDVVPGNPATSVVTFADADVGNANWLDMSWALSNGLTVANTTGAHTMNLGGNTLTLNGGTLNVGNGVSVSSAIFTNGTLKLGDTAPANLNIGYGKPGIGTATVSCVFSANLGTVNVGYDNGASVGTEFGTLDLRNATPLQGTFACGTLRIGMMVMGGNSTASGAMYLNDAGGVITNLQVAKLYLGNGTLTLNTGAAIVIGSGATNGDLTVGYGYPGGSATLAPTGPFTAYLGNNTVIVGRSKFPGVVTGTLDLRHATPRQGTFACKTFQIGYDESKNGLPTGTVYLNDAGGVITNFQVQTLTIGNGSLTLNAGAAIIIGTSTNCGDLTLGQAYGGGSATLAPTGPFTAYLGTNTVTVGQATANGSAITGTLDLRNAVPSQSTFACATLNIGIIAGNRCGTGNVYLNDTGGVITNLQVQNLTFGNGTLVMKNGSGTTIGSSINRGSLLMVGGGVGGTEAANLAPTGGTFSAYVTNMVLGQAAGVGTLNLTNTTLQALDVSGTATIGNSGSGKGIVYLGPGSASFTNLVIGVGTTATGNLLQLAGTTLTIGNGLTNVFTVAPTNSIVLDFSHPLTELKVYGKYDSFGPATNLPYYLAHGRVVVTNDNGRVRLRYEAPYSILTLRAHQTGGVLIVQ